MTRVLRPALVALLVLVPAASAQAAPLTTPCGGRAITPDKVITGEFGTDLNKTYVMVPFDVPTGTTAVRVKYCWDRPESGSQRHTSTSGCTSRASPATRVWGEREFRGWGGSSHPDVTLSAEGFSSEADYRANPRIEVPGKTTRGFLPGPIRPGEWAAELGVGAVIPKSDGDADGKVAWRVEIEFADDPAFADEPYRPTPYNRNPVRATPGWYSGDFHVHAEHSAYGNATMIDSFNYAFTPVSKGGGGLDFITLSDYVTTSAWGEIGKFQPWFPHNLIIPSAEIITYKGHTNNHGSLHFVDYRTGPIYELQPDGTRQADPRHPRPAPRSSTRSTASAAGPRSTTRRSSRPSTPPRRRSAAAASGSTRRRRPTTRRWTPSRSPPGRRTSPGPRTRSRSRRSPATSSC